MSNSSLISCTILSPNHSGPRTHAIDRITPHCVVGQCTVEALGALFAKKSRSASSNYGIGADGRIGLYVDEGNRSWCTSSRENDQRAVTIEVASDAQHPYTFRPAAYSALIDLCADICRRNGKTKLFWLGDKDITLTYSPAPDEMILTVHRWYEQKACPGDWLFSRMGELAAAVNARLAQNNSQEGDEDMITLDQFKELWFAMRKELQDNDASEYSEAARKWAIDTGIVAGGSSKDFNGMWEDVLTREQAVTMLYRNEQLNGRVL